MINFSFISWREQITFQWDNNDVRFVLDQHAYLDFFIVLAYWNNSLRVDISLHSDRVSWTRANKSLLLFNAECLVDNDNEQIPI
jgi:hypothetical protein